MVKIKDTFLLKTQDLQESLRKERHEHSLKEADLDYKLKSEKTKLNQIQQTNNELRKLLEHQLEIKQQIINSTNTSLDHLQQQYSSLMLNLESAQNEIISLKSHIGSTTAKSSESWIMVKENGEDNQNKEVMENTPTVTLVKTSNTNGIDPTRFTKKMSLTKETKYTMEAVTEFNNNLDCAPDIFIFHVL